tara:strand:+ start:650 stop:868 length:219 start_codon:yes stop_codon:yes gene_type:complete
MASHQLEIPLFLKTDKRNEPFMIGSYEGVKLTLPLDEVTFIIFEPVYDDNDNIVEPGKLIIRQKQERKTYGP